MVDECFKTLLIVNGSINYCYSTNAAVKWIHINVMRENAKVTHRGERACVKYSRGVKVMYSSCLYNLFSACQLCYYGIIQ